MSKEYRVHDKMQEALDWIDAVEGENWQCEAMREFIHQLDEAGFNPETDTLVLNEQGYLTFYPEQLVEGLPKEVLGGED